MQNHTQFSAFTFLDTVHLDCHFSHSREAQLYWPVFPESIYFLSFSWLAKFSGIHDCLLSGDFFWLNCCDATVGQCRWLTWLCSTVGTKVLKFRLSRISWSLVVSSPTEFSSVYWMAYRVKSRCFLHTGCNVDCDRVSAVSSSCCVSADIFLVVFGPWILLQKSTQCWLLDARFHLHQCRRGDVVPPKLKILRSFGI